MQDKSTTSDRSTEYAENLLKDSVLTINMQGISKDIKYFIQKKVQHNTSVLTETTKILSYITSSSNAKTKELLLGSDTSGLRRLLKHVTEEIEFTDVLINNTLERLMYLEGVYRTEKRKTSKRLEQP